MFDGLRTIMHLEGRGLAQDEYLHLTGHQAGLRAR